MWTYFKPWRRKIGVVTLILACVFAAGWVRSLCRPAFIHLELDDHKFSAIGTHPGILDVYWLSELIEVPDPDAPPIGVVVPPIEENVFGEVLHDRLSEVFGEAKAIKLPKPLNPPPVARTMMTIVPTFAVPFWSIVLPLTLLSAYLLLSKPKRSIPITKPNSDHMKDEP